MTSLWKGSLRISSSVESWYLRISSRATVPAGRYLRRLCAPPAVVAADLRAAIVANCCLGALPPVDLVAFCLMRAMLKRPRRNKTSVRIYVKWSNAQVLEGRYSVERLTGVPLFQTYKQSQPQYWWPQLVSCFEYWSESAPEAHCGRRGSERLQ